MEKCTSIVLDGKTYELATTLRVAYRVQGQNNHKPYSEVFANLGDMPLEDQVGILYEAFWCANPAARAQYTRQQFLEEYLDHYNVKQMMLQLKTVIQGIMGVSDDEVENANPQPEQTTTAQQ